MESCVLAILEGYLDWEKRKREIGYEGLTGAQKDRLRLQYDRDAQYYHAAGLDGGQALHADTVVSFWGPYKRLLQLEAGWTAYKTEKSLERLLYQTRKKGANDFTESIRAVNASVEDFARVCYTSGNFMLLPRREMNVLRYRVAEDRIDTTLYECFENGALAHLFQGEDALARWIAQQRLHTLFAGDIRRENLIWMAGEDEPRLVSRMSARGIRQYLQNAVQLIRRRSARLAE